MKSCTDLEQSKKLTEFLSLESADCYWDYDEMQKFHRISWFEDGYNKESQLMFNENNVCAWSLAVLLDIIDGIKMYGMNRVTMIVGKYAGNQWFVELERVHDNSSAMLTASKQLIDACYEMILKLHELKML